MVAKIISMFPGSTAGKPDFIKPERSIPYAEKVALASKMRKNPTAGERLMRNMLVELKRHFADSDKPTVRDIDFDFEFIKQSIECGYIVDFFIPELKLAIEIDGCSHYGREKQDETRDRNLCKGGITVVRFSEHDVKHNRDKSFWRLRHLIMMSTYVKENYRPEIAAIELIGDGAMFPILSLTPKEMAVVFSYNGELFTESKYRDRIVNQLRASMLQAPCKHDASGLFTK